ncbi:ABC transporter substrate-binding protein [Anaerocolumna aminovalerica]|uniref:NitT/TauT family transport system substrate-binding protein n=1 Tax=Anaerocolumna aminovalerica TaxID=1527 RepID=A0A1I5J7L2_9FIRM|nr:ABC transporter substrate-binding protein [Anaerocolumna aminovalerica]SFO68795.1 NitT/TauT family transport system substrate-binding protein [Anaerocolumna aminovalerica]
MKKFKMVALMMLVFILITGLSACKKDSNLIKVQLNEVAHSVFYAPQYVAIELGYFKEEGLDVKLVNGLGADKTMTAVLSGEADIGFMGAEASIYVYNEGAEDYVVNFAQLTQRAGNFLVSKDVNEDFSWENVKGKTVIGGRAGGMPQMVFEYILKKQGIDPKKDLTIIQNIDFGLTSQAFMAGTGDYTIEFEPSANAIEKEGAGKVVASLGVESGKVPYTAYAARKSYIEKNPEIIQKFTNAIQKGMDYVQTHTPEEIAKVIAPQFKETDLKTVTAIVKRYYDQDTWKDNVIFEEESLNLLQNILGEAGELSAKVPYKDLITREFAENAYKK